MFNLSVFCLDPLEEEPEPDIVAVRGELPVQTLTVLVCRHTDRHSLPVSNLNHGNQHVVSIMSFMQFTNFIISNIIKKTLDSPEGKKIPPPLKKKLIKINTN